MELNKNIPYTWVIDMPTDVIQKALILYQTTDTKGMKLLDFLLKYQKTYKSVNEQLSNQE